MRYYVFKIFYNKVAQAEDRPVNKGFDTLDDALKEYHSYLASNINAETCGWVLCMIINEHGKVEKMERWDAPAETPAE